MNESTTPEWNRSDWSDDCQYAYTDSLSVAQWAWEFLRRNRNYQHDWAWFDATWKALEERYGKPPDRDFSRWERDPDAYRSIDDDCGDCRVDQDRVLIECWMGNKWGFYKFPLSPATAQPISEHQLSWRELDPPVHLLENSNTAYLAGHPEKIALGFDIDLPLREQVEAARQFLQIRQARLKRQGKMQTLHNVRPRWRLLLRLLDARYASVAWHNMPDIFTEVANIDTLLEEADGLVNGGYRALLRIPAR